MDQSDAAVLVRQVMPYALDALVSRKARQVRLGRLIRRLAATIERDGVYEVRGVLDQVFSEASDRRPMLTEITQQLRKYPNFAGFLGADIYAVQFSLKTPHQPGQTGEYVFAVRIFPKVFAEAARSDLKLDDFRAIVDDPRRRVLQAAGLITSGWSPRGMLRSLPLQIAADAPALFGEGRRVSAVSVSITQDHLCKKVFRLLQNRPRALARFIWFLFGVVVLPRDVRISISDRALVEAIPVPPRDDIDRSPEEISSLIAESTILLLEEKFAVLKKWTEFSTEAIVTLLDELESEQAAADLESDKFSDELARDREQLAALNHAVEEAFRAPKEVERLSAISRAEIDWDIWFDTFLRTEVPDIDDFLYSEASKSFVRVAAIVSAERVSRMNDAPDVDV